MKVTVLESVMGILGFDENNALVDYVLFPKDAKTVAETLLRMEAGRIVDEQTSLIERLKSKGYTFFIFENNEAARNAHEKLNVAVEIAHPSPAGESLRANMEQIAVQIDFVKEPSELLEWTHRVSMEMTKQKVEKLLRNVTWLWSKPFKPSMILTGLSTCLWDESENGMGCTFQSWIGLSRNMTPTQGLSQILEGEAASLRKLS
jgi:hypothetical protein